MKTAYAVICLFSTLLATSLLKAEPLKVNNEIHGDNTCVYYEVTYSNMENCHTVRGNVADKEGWYHRYGDVVCANNCGPCSRVTIKTYIYDRYGKNWILYNGWYGQKMSRTATANLVNQLSQHAKPPGDINDLTCGPELPCGQSPQNVSPKYVNSEQYGDSTCVYYDYARGYYTHVSSHTVRKNNDDGGGWYHRYGDVTCSINCGNSYRLNLTTYIFDKNNNVWVTKRGWHSQKINPKEACTLLESIKKHRKPDGDINTIKCGEISSLANLGERQCEN